MENTNKYHTLTSWEDWTIEKNNLPIIIYGGEKADYNDCFDTRNKFVILFGCYDSPPVFKIKSLDGTKEIDRCFPLAYRLLTPLEIYGFENITETPKESNEDLLNVVCSFSKKELDLIRQSLMHSYNSNVGYLEWKKDDFSQKEIPKEMERLMQVYDKIRKL